jgi:tetratricopeptide (TPR) repeat protein
MKYLLLFLGLYPALLKAQNTLTFDKRFVQCEDKWVAFQMNKDSSYSYGFIYIDAQAGLTFNLEGTFKIGAANVFVPTKMAANVKYRLQANQVKVAVIPSERLKELQLPEFPDWLKSYETDTASVARLYRWGFLYNSWDECAKALTYLERAQEIDPGYKGLKFELAYAYNALGQYDKALPVLNSAIGTDPNNCYLYKELAFAEMHLGQLEKASETGRKGIVICSDNQMKSEIAYNLAYGYYKIKDKEKFKYWADETRKWATNGDQFTTNIHKMEAEIIQ